MTKQREFFPLDLYIRADWANEIAFDDACRMMLDQNGPEFEKLIVKSAKRAAKAGRFSTLKSGRLVYK